ncbi:MAG: DsbA family protein [Candidatus Paceibacterota bacterium]
MENNKYFLPVAVIVAGLLIAGAVVWNGQRPATTPGGAQIAVDIKDINLAGRPFIGKADAPLTIAFWSDFQCPFCKAFETGGIPQINDRTPAAFPQIVKDYVETGKVKIVFMDFAFLGNDSTVATQYGQAVWKLYPEQYFVWRTAMYEAQDEEGDEGFGDAASIDKLNASIAGLDVAKIAADVAANKAAYNAVAEADKAEGAKVGIDSTPSIVIGTQLIKGAYPYANFKAAIDAELSK